jgi:hypothetical protein
MAVVNYTSRTGVGFAEQFAFTDLSDIASTTGTGTVGILNISPTLVQPTVADLTNMTHTHSSAAGGGFPVISAVTLSDVASKTGSGTILVMASVPTIMVPTIADLTNMTHDHTSNAEGGVIALGGTTTFEAQGRLTLTTATPVTTADVTGAATLYYTPYVGEVIWLYDGVSAWTAITFAEISLSLAGYTANKNYDIWIYNNSGTATLESTIWTNDTTRATALVYQDGVLVKTGATTRRYVGTIRINATGGQTEDTATQRFVANYYNRVSRRLFSCPAYADGNSQTTYTTTSLTWAEANGGTGSKVEFVSCNGEIPFRVQAAAYMQHSTVRHVGIGVAIDSASSPTVVGFTQDANGYGGSHCPPYVATVAAGYHYLDLLIVMGGSGGTTTYIADDLRRGAGADPYATYISGEVLG